MEDRRLNDTIKRFDTVVSCQKVLKDDIIVMHFDFDEIVYILFWLKACRSFILAGERREDAGETV